MRRLTPGLTPALLALAAVAALPATARLAAAQAAPAQRPVSSPRETVRATVGGVRVMVDYGRPSKRGRTIFAAAESRPLVPYGKVWRTGANAATGLVTSGDLLVGATRLPKGSYTLYTIPSATGWQLVVNGQTGQWGTDYDQSKDVARIPMQVTSLGAPVEQFTIAVEPQGGAQSLVMRWDTVQAAVPLRPAR